MLTLYTKPDCIFCEKAKAHLLDLNIPFEEFDVSHDPEALLFIKAQGHTTVPQIYKDGVCIAPKGYEDLIHIDPFRLH